MSVINSKNIELSGPGPAHTAFSIDSGGVQLPDWEVILFPPDPATPGDTWARGVRFGSRIYPDAGDVEQSDIQAVSGLLSADPPDAGDVNACGTRAGDKVWLQIAVSVDSDTGLIGVDSLAIHSDEQDGDWAGGPFEYESSTDSDGNPIHVIHRIRKLLGIVLDDGSGMGVLTIRRNVFGPLVLVGRLENAVDASGAGPDFMPVLAAVPF